jgi:ribosomal protein S18 acetylase RimI-like enzyme
MLDESSKTITLVDKRGHTFSVRPYETRDLRELEEFYSTFEPKRGAQGLPPADAITTHRWLDRILNTGFHLLVDIEGRIAGHLMLIPVADRPDTLELANFLHQSVRNRGIGTIVNRLGAELALGAGASALWLSVEPSNKVAIRSYENAGFQRLAGSLWAPEIEMEMPLLSTAISA